jgi:hypothetical protein
MATTKKKTTTRKKKVEKVQPVEVVQPNEELHDIEVSSRWFKIKIDDINFKTIIVVAMMLAAAVAIVGIVI